MYPCEPLIYDLDNHGIHIYIDEFNICTRLYYPEIEGKTFKHYKFTKEMLAFFVAVPPIQHVSANSESAPEKNSKRIKFPP